MIAYGTPVVVCDAEKRESYIARLMEDYTVHGCYSPVVCIVWMLVYPRQTAIMHPELVVENPPLDYGIVTRMPFACRWPLSVPSGDYQESVTAARKEYITEAMLENRQDVLEVLNAHAEGIYKRPRKLFPVTCKQRME